MARRYRYNPSQKRDYHGRWTKGSLAGSSASGKSAARSTAGTARTYSGNTRRYEAYLAKQAAQKKAARKAAVKKVAIGATVIGAAAAGVYVGSRGKPPVSKNHAPGHVPHRPVSQEGPRVGLAGPSSTPKKVEIPSSAPRKVSPTPIAPKAIAGTRMLALPPGKSSQQNHTASPIKTPVVSGVSTVQAEGKLQQKTVGPKPKANPAGNPTPTPRKVVTEDGKTIHVVRGLNDAERIALERRAVEAAARLRAMEKKAGVQVGKAELRKFDREQKAKYDKRQAAKKREEEKRQKRAEANRKAMSEAIRSSVGVEAMIGQNLSRRERAEVRYASILEGMLESGKPLKRNQRVFLKEYMG